MKTELENAIKALAERAKQGTIAPHEAMQLTQAAANLAHVLNLLKPA